MRTKVKTIRRLSHQFSALLEAPKLDAYEIFSALETSGIIEAVGYRSGEPTHYREVLSERLTQSEFEKRALSALVAYCRYHGLTYVTKPDLAASPEKPEDHYDPNDFGV